MCCTKLVGKMEIEFSKELFNLVKGDYAKLRIRTHDDKFIGMAEYSVSIMQRSIVLTFGKPKEGCCHAK